MDPSAPDRATDRPVAAAFDLDGTLTRRDTLLPFLRFAVGDRRFWPRLVGLAPILGSYAGGRSSNTRLKEALVSRLLAGLDDEVLADAGARFAATRIDPLLRPAAVDRLRWHQARGHRTALVSASFEVVVVPWARRMGFDVALGTRLSRVASGVRVDNCHGPAKVSRLAEAWGDLGSLALHAYGDGDGDAELLAAAAYPWFRTFGGQPQGT